MLLNVGGEFRTPNQWSCAEPESVCCFFLFCPNCVDFLFGFLGLLLCETRDNSTFLFFFFYFYVFFFYAILVAF